MILLFLTQVVVQQEIVVSHPPPAPPGLFAGDDYPPEALRKGWQGDVTFDVIVGTNGRVSACRIVQSSGHQILDDATCKIVTERARFSPAQDAAGKPIESHYQRHINWR